MKNMAGTLGAGHKKLYDGKLYILHPWQVSAQSSLHECVANATRHTSLPSYRVATSHATQSGMIALSYRAHRIEHKAYCKYE